MYTQELMIKHFSWTESARKWPNQWNRWLLQDKAEFLVLPEVTGEGTDYISKGNPHALCILHIRLS